MQTNWKSLAAVGVIGIAIGVLIGTQFSCASQPQPTKPEQKVFIPAATTDTIKPGAVLYDTVKKIKYRVDTLVLHDTIYWVDTVLERVTGANTLADGPVAAAPPKPFSLPGAFLNAAPAIIASFKAQTPKQTFEIYAHADHDLLGGGYGGGFEGDLNLERLNIANVTLFADIGYDHAFHAEVGGRGKVAGLW